MKIHDMPQGSKEWHEVRTGRITATSFPTMANPRNAASREKLCRRVATERNTGHSSGSDYTNSDMERGIELEAEARNAYESTVFCHVREVGFIEKDDLLGCSPDGLIGEDGGVEIKCPKQEVQTDYWMAGKDAWHPHRWQIQGALWITGRAWWDFVTYCPSHPGRQQLIIHRVTPDAKAFEKLTAGAKHCRERIAEIVKGYGNGDPNQDV